MLAAWFLEMYRIFVKHRTTLNYDDFVILKSSLNAAVVHFVMSIQIDF